MLARWYCCVLLLMPIVTNMSLSAAEDPEYLEYLHEKELWEQSGIKNYSFVYCSLGFEPNVRKYIVRNRKCVGSKSYESGEWTACTHGNYCRCTRTMDSVFKYVGLQIQEKGIKNDPGPGPVRESFESREAFRAAQFEWLRKYIRLEITDVRVEYDSLHTVRDVDIDYVRGRALLDGSPSYSIKDFTVEDSAPRKTTGRKQ